MAKQKTYTFKTRVKRIKGVFLNSIVAVPDEIMDALNVKGRVRTKGTMNGAPFALAIQSMKDGTRYFSVSAQLRKDAKAQAGDPVTVMFWLVDADKVDVPEELLAVLEQDQEGKKVWDTFTPGVQRGLSHYVKSVKNVDSRIKRAFEIVEKAKFRQLHFQKLAEEKKKKK